MVDRYSGDASSFDINWKERQESLYTHWTRNEINNQIQLAFRNHWEIFQIIMDNPIFNKGKRCLEVGCGRGSLSAYFSDAGYKCTLLDISPTVIEIAKRIFKKNNLEAEFVVGDANNLPFKDNSFDIIFSIGLLEHIEDIKSSIKEQVRVLDKGGIFIAYIVPENHNNIQKEYQWINQVLKGYANKKEENEVKAQVFRTDYNSEIYTSIMNETGLLDVETSGLYPLPMISHSIEFPFTLMPEQSEKVIVNYFQEELAKRKLNSGKHPWFCNESYGQAFIVWGVKP